ncbi:MAG: glycosyltransferase family 1 protein [Pyrinomonadaceae bacterium]
MNKEKPLAERFAKLYQRYIAPYFVVSAEPLIIHIPFFRQYAELAENSYGILFQYLREKKVYLLCSWGGYIEKEDEVEQLAAWQNEFLKTHKYFIFTHLCNTKTQLETFGRFGLDAISCNHNSFIDEKIFFPQPNKQKIFDAVYDATLSVWKRHFLAEKIKKLALIYYNVQTEKKTESRVKETFAAAEFFNHTPTGEYKRLSVREVNECLNLCRVGLCLSEEEGAMYASIQYLLCGLPVVTTPSRGGRDVFFDDEYVLTVKPDAGAVKEAVETLIKKDLSPVDVRQKTLEKIYQHRQRFINLIQSIYDRENCRRDFAVEFDKIFFNRLIKNQNHLETIERLR